MTKKKLPVIIENMPDKGEKKRGSKIQAAILREEIWSAYCHNQSPMIIATTKNVSKETVYNAIRVKTAELHAKSDDVADREFAVSSCDALSREGWSWIHMMRDLIMDELDRHQQHEESRKEWCKQNGKPFVPQQPDKLIGMIRDHGKSAASLIEAIGHQEDRKAKLRGLMVTKVAGEDGKSSIHGPQFDKLMEALHTPIEIIVPEERDVPDDFFE